MIRAVYQTKLRVSSCANRNVTHQFELLYRSLGLSSALHFVPFVGSSVWVWAVPGSIAAWERTRALQTVAFRHPALAISLTPPLSHQYLFSWQLEGIVFVKLLVSFWIWKHFLVAKTCIRKKLLLAAGVLQGQLLISAFFYSSVHMADNTEILFSQPPLFSYTSHCSDIWRH